jgi:serine protease inhibitor
MDRIKRKFDYGTVNIKTPEFSFEFEQNLIPILQGMCIQKAFTEDADFRNISIEDKVFLSKVQHKSFIKVSHLGVEAGSATVELIPLSAKSPAMADWLSISLLFLLL